MAGTNNAGNKLSEERKKEYLDGKAAVNTGVVKLNEAIKKRNEQERKKTAADRMWERGSQTSASEKTFAKRDLETAKQNVAQKEKELSDYQENTNLDWTNAAARELYEKGEKQKKQEIAQAQAEQNAAVARLDRVQMDSLSEEDQGLIDEYIRREDTASDPIDTGTAAITEHFSNNLGIDEKRLKELVSTRRRELNEKRMQETQEKAQAEVNDGVGSAVWENVKTVPANLMSGAMSTMGYIHELANRDERYTGLDPNNMGNELNVYSGAVRGQTQQNIVGDGSSLVRRGLGTLYQAGMSAVDTGARAAVGGVLGLGAGFGATVAGLNTFGQTMADASARGATPEQAVALAVTTAGIEALTEKYSLDNLIDVSRGGGAKSLIKNVLRQMGVEASEEEASLILTTLADAAIMQEKSEYNQTVLEYMAQGMTEQQAREQANWGLVQEAVETAVVSGIAGGLGGFGAAKAAAFSTDNLDTAPQQAAQQPQTEQNRQVEQSPVNQEAAVQAAQEAQKPMTEQERAQQSLNDAVAEMGKNAPKPEAVAKSPEQENLDRAVQMTLGMEPEARPANAENVAADNRNDVDIGYQEAYNNSNNQPGGMNNAGAEYQNGQQNDGAGSTGNPASGLAGVQQSDGADNQGRGQSGGLAGDTGVLRVSDKLQEAQRKRGTQTYPVRDTTGNPDSYEQALIAGRNSDQKNGWCVTPKSAQELRDGNIRTFMNESGTVGVGVAPDGDIVAVFKNRNGGPRKALDTLMPIAIEQGGDRLDCYGEGLVKAYASYGFMPVARVEFNPEYANDGWTPEKGTPYIYMMMHNGDSADKVVSNMGSYDIPSQEQLNALPTYGKDDYDSAMAYRDSLMKQRSAPQADTQNMSAQDGQKIPDGMKGTGAAEQNFSGKAAYQGLLTDENTQRDRPGDVRPMEVPKEDGYGRKVSEFAGNAYGAEVTPDRMANEIESLIQDGALGFDRRSNKQSLENAWQYIYGSDGTKGKGEAGTRSEITRNIANGKIQDGDIEKAMLLYAKYANRKSTSSQENAAEIMVDLATMANMTGRNLQLFKILRRMTPEGQLMTVQKGIQRNVESMVKAGKVKKGYEASIDPELMQDYLDVAKECIEADTPQKQKEAEGKRKQVENAIYMAEAAKMPATFKAKWDAWRYMCMLGNAKTQVRNVVGNAAFMPYKAVKDKMGALMEKFIPQEQRTKSLTTDQKLLEWAKADAKSEEVQDALKYSAKLGDDVSGSKLAENQKVFDTKALETVRKWTEKIPAAGDMLFKNPYYAKSLAGFLRARGYTAADIQSGRVDNAILNEARGYAIDEAMKATFNDSNAFSDFMANELRYKGTNPIGKAANTLAEGVMPFRRTPANIVVRFAEYSPAGVGKAIWNAATKVHSGEMTAATVIDQLSAGLTGTGAMALGYALANGLLGVKLTGSDVSEDEKRQGHQEYALEFSIDGKEYSYKIDWAAPANMPLFVGANIHDLLEKAGADTDVSKFTAFVRGMGTMFEPMLSLSCLSSLNDILDSVSYADSGEKLYALASSAATSYFTQGIPALARQAAQASQENKQITFANSDDPTIRDLQKTTAKIPFAGSAYQTDKVTPWGEKESNGDGIERTMNAFVNPGTLKEIDNSGLETEISRLNGVQPENVTPPYAAKVVSYTDKNGGEHLGQRLTEEQYQTLATVQGQTAKRISETMIQSKDYAAMTDQQKAEAVKLAYQYAQEKGRMAALEDYPELSGWQAGIDGKEAEAIIRKVNADTLDKAISDLTTAWANGWDDSTKTKALETAYSTLGEMSRQTRKEILAESSQKIRDYADARDAGISNQKYVDILKSKAAAAQKKGGTLNQGDNIKILSGVTGVTDAQKELLFKADVSDTQDQNIDEVKALVKEYNLPQNYLKLYAEAYDITENYTKGDGKKKRTVAYFREQYGLSQKVAEALYEVYK